MAQAEISPGVEKISGDDVVYGMVRIMEFCRLFLVEFLELFDQRLVFFAVFDGNFHAGSAIGSSAWLILNVHVDKFIRKIIIKAFK